MSSIGQVVASVMAGLRSPEKKKRNILTDAWPKIAGPKIAPHTKPYLKENGELFIWVDQSALAFEINQRYRPSLIKRAQAVLGEEAVRSVRVRVGEIR